MLELDPIANRLIGSDEDGGLSLEQRKRTTLGVELAANPSLIFLDEPTSGLDARSAQVCSFPRIFMPTFSRTVCLWSSVCCLLLLCTAASFPQMVPT